jgi:TolB protein
MYKYFFQIFLVFFIFSSEKSFGILSIDIDSGKIQKQKILFVGLDKNLESDSYITEIIRNDLNNSGLFETYFNKNLGINEGELRFEKNKFEILNQKEISFLVFIDLDSNSKNLFLDYRIWNVSLKKNILEKRIRVSSSEIRKLAHSISDDLYFSSTGFSGYFNTRIFYVSESGPKERRIKKLAVMDYDGYNNQFLSDGKFLILTPRISSDNSKILYVSYQKKIPRIFMLDLESMRHFDLLDMKGISSAPRFAFYNNNLITAAISDFGNTNIFEFNLSNGFSRKLTNNSFINTSPSYSPDNNQIIFSSDRLGKGNSQIFLMNSNGFNQEKISKGPGQYFNPVFSPNGEWIAFTKLLQGNFYIGIMKKNGSEERILAGGYMLESPCWCPNSRLIVFSSTNKSNLSSLYMVDISGKFHQKILLKNDNDEQNLGFSDPMWSN